MLSRPDNQLTDFCMSKGEAKVPQRCPETSPVKIIRVNRSTRNNRLRGGQDSGNHLVLTLVSTAVPTPDPCGAATPRNAIASVECPQ